MSPPSSIFSSVISKSELAADPDDPKEIVTSLVVTSLRVALIVALLFDPSESVSPETNVKAMSGLTSLSSILI